MNDSATCPFNQKSKQSLLFNTLPHKTLMITKQYLMINISPLLLTHDAQCQSASYRNSGFPPHPAKFAKMKVSTNLFSCYQPTAIRAANFGYA
jgi:hypothetical protein